MTVAFQWYGGKTSKLGWILPLLPAAHHFCEVFCGSAAVALSREPSPIETINDLDGEVTNFFTQLRERGEELISLLELTPYSKREIESSLHIPSTVSELERARLFFIRIQQGYTGIPTKRGWSSTKKYTSRGLPMQVSNWLAKIDGLPDVVSRLRTIQIDNVGFDTCIVKYDTPETLFYCDPPYLPDTREKASRRVYRYEMSLEDHEKLAEILVNIQGKAAVSGYDHPLYRSLYKQWNMHTHPIRLAGHGGERIEVLWTNY